MCWRRARATRASPVAGTALLALLLCAIACGSEEPGDPPMSAAGAGSSPPAVIDPGVTGGNAAAPAPPAGGAASAPAAAGIGAAGSTIPNAPADAGTSPENRLDAAAAPMDASVPREAAVNVNTDPDCPALLPEVYAGCPREGLMCEYRMECCPDFAWCEFGQWTVLTHHCDACI
jgi:hypothetical protein